MITEDIEEGFKDYLAQINSEYIEILSEKALNGDADPLDTFILLRDMKKKIEDALKQVEDAAIIEAAKYGKSFEHNGYKIGLRDGSKRFTYKGIIDWDKADADKKKVEEMLKMSWASNEKGIQSITDDGEVIPVPKVSYGKSSITLEKMK